MTVTRYLAPALLLGTFLTVVGGCSSSKTPPRRFVESEASAKGKTEAPAKTEAPQKNATETAARPPVQKKQPERPANPLVKRADGQAGVLRGEVRWKGPVPPPLAKADDCFVVVNDQRVAVPPPPPVKVDPASQGVADVLVWLAKPPADAERPDPAALRLTQSRGAFSPRVQVAPVGSTLQLRTLDDAADFQGGVQFRKLVKRGEPAQVSLARPGLIVVRSEDRPWVLPAHVRVLPHAYHAVTGPDGTFELPKVPPGKYHLAMWHPGWKEDPTKMRIEPVKAVAVVTVDAAHGAAVRWELAEPMGLGAANGGGGGGEKPEKTR